MHNGLHVLDAPPKGRASHVDPSVRSQHVAPSVRRACFVCSTFWLSELSRRFVALPLIAWGMLYARLLCAEMHIAHCLRNTCGICAAAESTSLSLSFVISAYPTSPNPSMICDSFYNCYKSILTRHQADCDCALVADTLLAISQWYSLGMLSLAAPHYIAVLCSPPFSFTKRCPSSLPIMSQRALLHYCTLELYY